MLEKIYWFLEITSLVICVNSVQGTKVKRDIKTIVFIAIEILFMDSCRRGIITNHTYFVIYILYVLYVYLELKSSLKEAVFSAVLSIIIVGLMQMIIAFPVYKIGDCFKASENIMVLIINALVFLFILIVSRCKFFQNIYVLFARKEFILNFTFGVVAIIYGYCLYLLKESEKIQADLYVIIIVSVITIACILFRWRTLEKEAHVKQNQIALSNQYSEDYSALVEISRKKQHDFNNQISALCGMQGVVNEDSQKSYVDEVLERNKILKILHTVEHPVLAGFLHEKLNEIMELGIRVDFDLSVPEGEIGIELFDCIEILGILLDNAVEAVTAHEMDKKIILYMIAIDENITISVKNVSKYYENDEIASFLKKDYSTKGESRGIGLSKIKDLQRKYNFDIIVEMQEIHNEDWISFSITKNAKV